MKNSDNRIASGSINEYLSYIRFFFNVFVLGYISIIITGKLLSQLPICRLKILNGRQIMNIDILILRLKATDDEVVIGLASFLSVVLIVGLFIGKSMQTFFNGHFGTNLPQFETICIFSSFSVLLISFILKILHASFNKKTYDDHYNEIINNLSKKTNK